MLQKLVDEHAQNERVEEKRPRQAIRRVEKKRPRPAVRVTEKRPRTTIQGGEENHPQPAIRKADPVRALTPQPVAQDPHFRDVIGALHRRMRMILTAALLGALLAAVVGLLIAPKYTAVAEIEVEPPPGSLDGRVLSVGDEITIDTHVARLSSRDQMARVLESLSPGAVAKTASPPAIVNTMENQTSNQEGGLSFGELASRLKMWSGIGRKNGSALNLDQLERRSKIMQARRSRIIRVAFTSKNPQQAAVLANRMVQLYVDAQNEQKRAWMNLELARFGERIAEIKNDAEGTRSAAQAVVDLSRRQDELRGEIEVMSPDVRIASLAAMPERPSSSNPLLFILPAFIICAIGASSFAVVSDRLDRGLRSERDVTDALGVPCIGLVPKTAKMDAVRNYKYMLAEPFSAYSEAIRAAAMTLKIVAKSRKAKVVLIGSSVPMEGKSTLALSLAAYLTVLGRRVLLVDLDFQQGSFLGELSGRTESEVLDLNFLNRSSSEFIHHIPDLGLDYFPMPRRRLDPLFVSEQVPRLLQQVRGSYDCVIIDGPSLLRMTEARLLPAVADKVLFVVKWGETRREVAQNALRLLREAGCDDRDWSELAASIVTQVDLKRHARYRFGDASELMAQHEPMAEHRNYYTHFIEAWRLVAAAAGSMWGRWRRLVLRDDPAASAE